MSTSVLIEDLRGARDYEFRPATPQDVDGARSVMLDTVYREFGYGYLPRFHSDIIDPVSYYLTPEDNALFVAVRDGRIAATAAVRETTPTSPPHPEAVADRFEPGRTATLNRVYVRPEHRRRGLATALLGSCLEFIASRERYTGVYLHTDARTPGAMEFWQRHGEVIFDERTTVNEQRTEPLDEPFETVHFAVPVPR